MSNHDESETFRLLKKQSLSKLRQLAQDENAFRNVSLNPFFSTNISPLMRELSVLPEFLEKYGWNYEEYFQAISLIYLDESKNSIREGLRKHLTAKGFFNK